MKDETETKHPSFGQISWSNVRSSHGEQLYGSSLNHTDMIHLSISQSTLYRGLSRDRYHEDISPIVEVKLSRAQFSEFMTTPNAEAVPCTIHQRKDLEGTPDWRPTYPGHESEQVKHDNEFRDHIAEVTRKADELMADAAGILEGKGTMTKADRTNLANKLSMLHQEIHSNMPFVANSYQEIMDKTVSHGKEEIENFIQQGYRRAGMEALGIEVPKSPLIEDDHADG